MDALEKIGKWDNTPLVFMPAVLHELKTHLPEKYLDCKAAPHDIGHLIHFCAFVCNELALVVNKKPSSTYQKSTWLIKRYKKK